VLFDHVEDLPTLDDPPVVGAILLGQLAGEEVEVRLPNEFLERPSELGAELLVGEAKATGSNYFTAGSADRGLIVISYFGSAAERCSRASIAFISLAGTRTPAGYSPDNRFTVG